MRPARQHSRPRGGGSRQSRRRLFERLEQEEQRLKKHDGRWMAIQQSLQLESFILTKLTKPSVPVNLVGPQVSLPQRWVPASRGAILYFVRNKEELPVAKKPRKRARKGNQAASMIQPPQQPRVQDRIDIPSAACSCLPWPAMLPRRPHRPLLFPPLARPCGDGSLTPQPNQ